MPSAGTHFSYAALCHGGTLRLVGDQGVGHGKISAAGRLLDDQGRALRAGQCHSWLRQGARLQIKAARHVA
eukprot:9406795-Pyramimonas_sp.AAC.1